MTSAVTANLYPTGFAGAYRFLSNFYPSAVVFEGITFPTVEHAFQAAKTLSDYERRYIANMGTPGEAKRAGRQLKNLRTDWESVKGKIMLDLLRQKFNLGGELAFQLIQTEGIDLVEWNFWHDQIWGRCTCNEHQDKGLNLLGQLLTQVRNEISLPF